MVKKIVVCFMLVLSFACDGNGNGSDANCIRLEDANLQFLNQFEDCPTDGLIQVCNEDEFTCDLFREGSRPPFQPPDFLVFWTPSECTFFDCFTLQCEFRFFDLFPCNCFTKTEIGILSNIRVFLPGDPTPGGGVVEQSNSNFTASVEIEGEEEIDFVTCAPIVPETGVPLL